MVDPRDVGRLIRFMRDEADDCSDGRKSWFTATGSHLERQRVEIEQLRAAAREVIDGSERNTGSAGQVYVDEGSLMALKRLLPTKDTT